MRLRALLAASALVAGVLLPLTPQAADASVVDDTAAAVSYAAGQGYRSSVAVMDLADGQFWGAGDYESTYASESLIKLFIATRLLVTGQMTGWNETTAYKMVTQSDDASANALYGRVGGDSLIDWVKQTYGIGDLGSPPQYSGNWGGTNLTAHGFASFYRAISQDGRVWPWVDNAIHHATVYGSDGQYQYFGIPSATTGFGIKQGWGNDDYPHRYPEFNSTGVVNGDRYAVVILTQGGTYGQPIMNVLDGEAQRILPGGYIRPPVQSRIAVVGADTRALVKEGGLSASWVLEDSNDAKVVLSGSRIAALRRDGTVFLKDGGLSASWVLEATDVADLALDGTRIGVVRRDGSVLVKDGTFASWATETYGGRQVALSGNRIGVVQADGTVVVKEGGLSAAWVTETTRALQVALAGSRIGVVQAGGAVWVKDGGLIASWTYETGSALSVVLAGNRIGVLASNGVALVKEGLYGLWVTEATGTGQLALTPTRVGVLDGAGVARVKDGGLAASWVTVSTSDAQLALS